VGPVINIYHFFRLLSIAFNLTLGISATIFDVTVEKGLELLTIRHYTDEVIERLTEGKNILLQQKTANTIQILFKG
jgi:hypothetical protein